MKTVVLATPRTGSTALCSNFNCTNYDELFSIENLILPRSADSKTILYEQLSEKGLAALESGDFRTAWQEFKNTAGVYFAMDENLTTVYTDKYPTLEYFLNEQQRRWDILSLQDDWVVKIMFFHHVPINLLTEIFSSADTIVLLKRRDMVAQSISIFLAQLLPTNEWHTEVDNEIDLKQIKFPYEKIIPMIENIKNENEHLEKIAKRFGKLEIVYYEDIDFSNSKHKKLRIHSNVDKDRCYAIAKEAGYDYTSNSM